MTDLPTVALIGVGTMGEALLAGALDGGLLPKTLRVQARRRERADELAGRYGVQATTDIAEAVSGAQLVVLAVIPQAVPEVLGEIADHLDEGAVLACIAYGVSLADLQAGLPDHRAVARAMPSLASQVGDGITLLTCSDECTEEQIKAATGFFGRSGTVLRLSEQEQTVLEPLSGGGPAYFFYLAAAMVDAGVGRGIPRPEARRLVADALTGAADWMAASDEEPAALIAKVCTPGGPGSRRMAVLDERGVPAAVKTALA
jgi:pyrroline-5-carboxylate reductase